jgi:hypothetical protein
VLYSGYINRTATRTKGSWSDPGQTKTDDYNSDWQGSEFMHVLCELLVKFRLWSPEAHDWDKLDLKLCRGHKEGSKTSLFMVTGRLCDSRLPSYVRLTHVESVKIEFFWPFRPLPGMEYSTRTVISRLASES